MSARLPLDDRLLGAALGREPSAGTVESLVVDVAAIVATTPQSRPGVRLPWRTARLPLDDRAAAPRRLVWLAAMLALLASLGVAMAIVGALLDRHALPVNGVLAYAIGQPEQTYPVGQGVFIADPAGGEPRQVSTDGGHGLAWSTDGRLAFWAGGLAEWRIDLYDPAADRVTTVVDFARSDRTLPGFQPLQWSADGTRLLADADVLGLPAILMIDVATGDVQPVGFANGKGAEPTWSPNRSRLAFLGTPTRFSDQWELYMADGDGRAPRRLNLGLAPGDRAWGGVRWLDEDALLLTIERPNTGYRLVRFSLRDGTTIDLSPWSELDLWASEPLIGYPSPDGRQVAVAQGETGQLAVVATDGSGWHDVARGACSNVGWAPDGTEIVFEWGCHGPVAPSSTLLELRGVRPDGSGLRTLLTREVAFQADGLVFDWQGIAR